MGNSKLFPSSNQKVKAHTFTLKFDQLSRVLSTPIGISIPESTKPEYNTRGIWDTGASGTVITQNVIKALDLKPTGIATVNTASLSGVISNTYLIDVWLKANLRLNVRATVG